MAGAGNHYCFGDDGRIGGRRAESASTAAIEPLATKACVTAAIQSDGEQTLRHFDVVAEGLRVIHVFAA